MLMRGGCLLGTEGQGTESPRCLGQWTAADRQTDRSSRGCGEGDQNGDVAGGDCEDQCWRKTLETM